ncbi:Zinc finger CCHC domain-containing 8 [Gossypium australe]|uniref:Zinc finger CCHC domain-containing 8 n=1 Tax=Gossypium australe TaxID=47621 RepID=A0A5B6WV75_9ROSI|nr:Zinc finger CCHC domain-containing 8 [Gossypium australe]
MISRTSMWRRVMLRHGDKTVAEYKAEFLRLSRYVHGLVATDYDKIIRFKEGLYYDIKVLVAPQRERVFENLVDKANITKDIKTHEIEKERGKVRRRGTQFLLVLFSGLRNKPDFMSLHGLRHQLYLLRFSYVGTVVSVIRENVGVGWELTNNAGLWNLTLGIVHSVLIRCKL